MGLSNNANRFLVILNLLEGCVNVMHLIQNGIWDGEEEDALRHHPPWALPVALDRPGLV